ncbi:MAG TPA: CHAT domain-containing tetratricopeptide repeat protein [Gemmataceae bacterium]|nr:CHAT domain-containing tetratricopeptide repeat protein [Gemmataceae bacterium]
MGHLSLPSALAVWVVAFPAIRPVPPPAPVPQLSTEDEEWRVKKYDEALKFGREGKWGYDEAQAPVREILDLCTRKLGKDHYMTATYRIEINILQKLDKLPEAGRLEYLKTYKLYDQFEELSKKKQYAEAQKPLEEMLDIYRRILGPGSLYEGVMALEYGQLFRSCEKYDKAAAQFRLALKILLDVVGEDHAATVNAYIYVSLTAESRDLYEKALNAARRVFGEGHWKTAVTRNNLAGYFERQADYAEAEKLYRQALAAFIAAGGEDGPGVAMGRNNLAVTLGSQGKYIEAEEHYRKALVSQRKLNRMDDYDIALFSGNLAVNLDHQGRHTEAGQLHRTALDIWVRTLGESHKRVAEAHSNLGVNLDHQGRYALAESHLDKAIRIFEALPKAEVSLGAATAYSNLASCLGGQERYTEGQAAAEKAVAIYAELLSPDHPKLAVARNNLASSLQNQKKYADAEQIFRQVLAALRKRLSPGHPDIAHGETNLSVNLYYQGRFADADPYLRSALEALRKGLGEGHPQTAWTYKSLVGNLCARGDYAGALALAEKAIASFEAARLRLGSSGLDRAQRTPDVSPLPGLSVAAARRDKFAAAWEALERNMARGLLDDLAAHPLSPEDRKLEMALVEKLNLLDRQIDELRTRELKKVADPRKIEKAEADRDAAQAELLRFQAGLTAKHGVASGLVYDLARIQKQLPQGAALVAWVDLPHVSSWHDTKGDHWACLVKHTGDPVWVQLLGTGDKDAWTAADERLARRVRAAVSVREPTEDWKDLTAKLAAQRLGPLKDRLDGIRHLIVLPSADMAGIPVEALTRLTVSYAPSGTMYAWLRERRGQVGSKSPANHLLAFADPAYKKGGDGPVPLPGSRQELAGIGRVFNRISDFKGIEASEQSLDRLAAEEGSLRRFGYLHFATHGVLDNERPMRSAILLAQEKDVVVPLGFFGPLVRLKLVLDGKEAYDGRLTAERILRRWNRQLDAELVTLSACQTGLGKYSGGEGYLGFSQALFLAGARSLVLSLWEVDDAATALLMTRFYENFMGLPKDVPGGPIKPRSKAEALAEAKNWLRGLTPEQVEQLAAGLPRQGTRGRIVPKAPDAPAASKYDLPYYWSGFILIGDPE